MRLLRYTLFTLLLIGCGTTAKAQFFAGGGLDYFTSDGFGLGIQLRAGYQINETWRGQAGYTFITGVEAGSASSFDLNANYIFLDNEENLKVYGLAGLNVTTFSFDGFDAGFGISTPGFSASDTGLNLGGGANLGLSDQLMLYGEVKYILSDFDGLVLSVGAMYSF